VSPEQGSDTRRWIVVIVSVVMGFSGLIFGIIGQASGQEVGYVRSYAEENRVEIKVNKQDIRELEGNFGILENEIRHIRNGIDALIKKTDKILEEGHN
jgi:hypothetical protein